MAANGFPQANDPAHRPGSGPTRRRLVQWIGAGAVGLVVGHALDRAAAQTASPAASPPASPAASPPATPGSRVGANPNGPLKGQEVNLYSARNYDSDQQIYDGFAAETGAKVNVIAADADQLLERIKSEGRNSPADVLITVDAGRLWLAQQAGLLKPVMSRTLLDSIPPNLRDPGGSWFGFSRRVRILAYAKDRVDPKELSTYEALADAAWSGRVLVRSSSNVYNQSLVGALIANDGREATAAWAKGLVANFARPPQGGDIDQIEGVAAGEGDVAIANHYYYLRLLNSKDPAEKEAAEKTALFFPNQGPDQKGVHVNISGGGMLKTAPHPEAAVAFLEYLISPAAQEIFARGNYEFPVLKGVPLDPSLEALGPFKADPMDASVYGANNQDALLLMIQAGWQ